MRRRDFLSRAALGGLSLVGAGSAGPLAAATPRAGAVAFVPGYLPKRARYRGRPLTRERRFNRAVPAGYDGPLTMITRIAHPGGPVRRAVFPIKGHAIAVRGRLGFFSGMNHPDMLSFDTESLDLVARAGPARRGWMGGGHAVFSADGRLLLVSERRPRLRYSGHPYAHFGLISVREPDSLKVVEYFSCGGIEPHEVALLADGRHIAVANYGSLDGPVREGAGRLPEIVEPCITVIEIASGRLVHKIHAPDKRHEIRHLAGTGLERLMAIQARLGAPAEEAGLMAGRDEVYTHDFTAEPKTIYLPAPALHLRRDSGGAPVAVASPADDPLLMRHGLSIIYEPKFDEFIASFPTAHCVMIFAGDGRLARVTLTEPLGLSYPCGVALHPDGEHYLVAGGWRGLFRFARGHHTLDRETTERTLFFGHSHIVVA